MIEATDVARSDAEVVEFGVFFRTSASKNCLSEGYIQLLVTGSCSVPFSSLYSDECEAVGEEGRYGEDKVGQVSEARVVARGMLLISRSWERGLCFMKACEGESSGVIDDDDAFFSQDSRVL